MGQKTIPQLQTSTVIDSNTLMVIDSGVQTYKITVPNFAKGLRTLFAPPLVTERTSDYSPTALQAGSVIPLNSEGGSFDVLLPDPATMTGLSMKFKDVGGFLGLFPVSLVPFGSEEIEFLASEYQLESDNGEWELFCNGVDYFFI